MVLQLPPIDSWSSLVSTELRNGTWPWCPWPGCLPEPTAPLPSGRVSASITLPSASSEVIFLASARVAPPVAPLLPTSSSREINQRDLGVCDQVLLPLV